MAKVVARQIGARDPRSELAATVESTVGKAAIAAQVLAIRLLKKNLGRVTDPQQLAAILLAAMDHFLSTAKDATKGSAVMSYVEGVGHGNRAISTKLRELKYARLKEVRRQLGFSLLDDAADIANIKANMTEEQIKKLVEATSNQVIPGYAAYEELIAKQLLKAAAKGMKEDLHVKDFSKLVRNTLTRAGVSSKPNVVNQITRDTLNMNFMAGRLSNNAKPEIQEILWGYRYVTVDDDRVRPTHAVLDGVCLPKDDPFWKRNMPPNGPNCRCSVIEVFKDENPTVLQPPGEFAAGETIYRPGADKGWDFSPLDAVPAGLSPPLLLPSTPVTTLRPSRAEDKLVGPDTGDLSAVLEEVEKTNKEAFKLRGLTPGKSSESVASVLAHCERLLELVKGYHANHENWLNEHVLYQRRAAYRQALATYTMLQTHILELASNICTLRAMLDSGQKG